MKQFIKKNYVSSHLPFATSEFSKLLFDYITKEFTIEENIIILCIGTDRSTGDSLGPLVGHKLVKLIASFENTHLLGTLNRPIHAKNLKTTINRIYEDYNDPFIIAVDSSLGSQSRVGFLTIQNQPLKPGSGVNKVLPEVGDISITGVVNIAGMMEFMVLQSTRLSLVMNMADIISKSIYLCLLKLQRSKYTSNV